MESAPETRERFTLFAADAEPRLRYALVAALGQQNGLDAAAEALAYGWEHRSRLEAMENPIGYLYRVGRSRVRVPRSRSRFVPVPVDLLPEIEPGLPAALERLSERQRVVVVMVHAYGWNRRDAAEMLGMSVSTIDSHLARALSKLRRIMGVTSDA